MNKINIKENMEKGLSLEEVANRFFLQVIKEESELDKKLNSIVIKERAIDPRLPLISIYAVLADKEIDKLISFDSDYMTFEKETMEIESLNFEVYNISYKEEACKAGLRVRVIKDVAGAEHAKNILIAEDDIKIAKEQLANIKNIF